MLYSEQKGEGHLVSPGGVTHRVILGIVHYTEQKGGCYKEFTRISRVGLGVILGIVCCHC